MPMPSIFPLLGIVATLALSSAAHAETRTLKASVHLPPKNNAVADGYEPFVKRVEEATKGQLKIRLFTGGSLLGPKAVSDGVRDGLADIGYVIFGYSPAEYPYGALITDMAAIGDNAVPVSAATTEFVMLGCEPCLAEFKANGNVYTGTYGTPPMVLMGMQPVKAPADLKGKKIRAAGSIWDRYIEFVEAIPVNVPSSEQYEALSRGAVDMVITSPTSLKGFSLWDVVKDVTLIDLGVYRAINTYAFNPKTWQSFSPEMRRLLLEITADSNLDIAHGYNRTTDEVIAGAKDKKIAVAEPTPEVKRNVDAFVEADLKAIAEIARTKHGIAKPEEHIAKMQELVAKWNAIWEESGRDLDKMKQRLRTDVIAKLDVERYGM